MTWKYQTIPFIRNENAIDYGDDDFCVFWDYDIFLDFDYDNVDGIFLSIVYDVAHGMESAWAFPFQLVAVLSLLCCVLVSLLPIELQGYFREEIRRQAGFLIAFFPGGYYLNEEEQNNLPFYAFLYESVDNNTLHSSTGPINMSICFTM
jgi:hypothetical protein